MVMSPEIKRLMEKSAHLLSHGHFHLGFGCLLFHWLLFWAWLLNRCCLASSADLLLQFQVLLPAQNTQNQNQNWGLEEKNDSLFDTLSLRASIRWKDPSVPAQQEILLTIFSQITHTSPSHRFTMGFFFLLLFVPWVNELIKININVN